MNPFDKSDGAKATTRISFIQSVRSHVGPQAREFFLMPASEGHDLALVRQAFPDALVDAVDYDLKVARGQHEKWRAQGVFCSSDTVSSYLEGRAPARPALLDAVWLDYIGMLSEEKMREAVAFAGRFTAPRAVLAVTVAAYARSRPGLDAYYDVLRRRSMIPETTKRIPSTDKSWHTLDATMGAIHYELALKVPHRSIRREQIEYRQGMHVMFFGVFRIER